ncbi:hypothetical protein B9Z55_018008 [Caenorhabditis nigoni]|nr:hypothetical protein B9Z55_018008 [Caenorhabditis nigoni]
MIMIIMTMTIMAGDGMTMIMGMVAVEEICPIFDHYLGEEGRYFGGGGGGGLFGRLFGWRRRGYYNQGYYQGYPNYGFCRLSQFVDYVGRVPRFYCDCPPYPPNYQWNQCSPMYG